MSEVVEPASSLGLDVDVSADCTVLGLEVDVSADCTAADGVGGIPAKELHVVLAGVVCAGLCTGDEVEAEPARGYAEVPHVALAVGVHVDAGVGLVVDLVDGNVEVDVSVVDSDGGLAPAGHHLTGSSNGGHAPAGHQRPMPLQPCC